MADARGPEAVDAAFAEVQHSLRQLATFDPFWPNADDLWSAKRTLRDSGPHGAPYAPTT